MFNELILQINPTITAIATIMIGLSIVTIGIVMILMRRAGLLAARFN
jgi:ABC-type spermidine/putrescine transport system permease subunit II